MPETFQVTVQHIRFHNRESGFTVALCSDEELGDALTIIGNFPAVQPGEAIAVVGEWQTDRKFGRQFAAESVAHVAPTSEAGILRYLAAGHVKGIGAALAKRLVQQFGSDLLRVIDEEPRRLRKVPGVGKRTLDKIKESWREQRGVKDLMIFLASVQIGGARAFRIHKQYGKRAVEEIRTNPFRLAHDIRGIGFDTADSIAQRLGHDPQSPFRVLAGVEHVLDNARQRGHCGLPVTDVVSEATELLKVPANLVSDAIKTAIANGVVIEEEVNGARVLFDPSLYEAESRIAAALIRLTSEPPQWKQLNASKAIQVAEADSGIELDATQRKAIDLALTSRAVVITGGPGVGKTTLVRALVAVFESAKLKVLLAAPTGRAAKRLAETTGSTAQTIHRLLEMSPASEQFQRNEANPLEADVLIVDEASMVDVPLLDAVLRAIPPAAALVLVGDADQLPSIGPGQVLHDILESKRLPLIRLTEIHRQAEGSHIIVNAHRINRGELPRFGAPNEQSDMFLFRAKSPERAVGHVIELVTTKIPQKFGFRTLRDVQVLAPMRKGSVGIDALNKELQHALNPPATHKERLERKNGVVFCPGDKVMQTENNYEKSVFNGDVGVIAMIDPEKELLTIDFGGELIRDYTFGEADQLTLAYATTIHKSQGSEYKAVIVVLMPQHHIMLRRNLLYTAVTRGRSLVVVVGDEASMKTAVRTGHGGERYTRLKHCLTGAAPPRL